LETFNLEDCECAVIVGGGHGIGFALVEKILATIPSCLVFATYRLEDKAQQLLMLREGYLDRLKVLKLDPLKEVELEKLYQEVNLQKKSVDLIINCVGTLYDDIRKPEKTLKNISFEQLSHYFAVNSIVTPLLAKHLLLLMKNKNISVLVSLSAKVGSIGDNRLGGWYGYRSSKAALNMLTKTLSIEFTNRKMNCIAIALHPGTTATELSQPYTTFSKVKIHKASDTASNILKVIDRKGLSDSGKFYSWDNTEIDW